jgi:PHP family Zn ribbon phosphoesterase
MEHKRLHHIGIILPSMEKVEDLMKAFGLEKD